LKPTVASRLQASRFSQWLQTGWWRPNELGSLSRFCHTLLTRPVAAVLGAVLGERLQLIAPVAQPPGEQHVPVLVVGNLVVGGAGKTPTVQALVRLFRQRGWRPGVISRGYGSGAEGTQAIHEVTTGNDATVGGDEPTLLANSCPGTPVFVGARRAEVVRALMQRHPEVDLIISDDGLQHRPLARQAQLIVFDERGVGNGRLLPAGPLRQPLPAQLPERSWVVYNSPSPSTPMTGLCVGRSLQAPQPWGLWAQRQGLGTEAMNRVPSESPSTPPTGSASVPDWASWRGQAVTAMAGIGNPDRFFDMLREKGLEVTGIGLPDHADLQDRPWQHHVGPMLLTAKDAIKVSPSDPDRDRLWVVSLDFDLPSDLIDQLECALRPPLPPSTR
jgi:tetraacyldisaccharide 4'-kinase